MIELPYNIKLRDYQQNVWNSFFSNRKKRYVLPWHRRAGKDKLAINLIVGASIERVGIYYYLFPELNQARRNVWEGIDKDGVPMISHFPKELIKRVDNRDMLIEFINGSIFRLCGADRYNSLMGANPVGIVLSEYALQNPVAWRMLVPILTENEGWAVFIYTFRGKNHGYDLYYKNLDNPDFYCDIQTIADTKRLDGSPVIKHEDVIKLVASGEMDEDEIQQEFYCNPSAALKGAFFSTQLKQAYEDNRISDFPIDYLLPVHTYWDVGRTDPTAIWFVQIYRNEIRCINYYENQNQDPLFYAKKVKEIGEKCQYMFGDHWGPHDLNNVIQSITHRTLKDLYYSLGINFRVVERTKTKLLAIQAAKALFSRVYFHKTNCKQGIEALTNYRKYFNKRNNEYSDEPIHDWACHGADAFMGVAQAFQQQGMIKQRSRIIENPIELL